MYTYITYFVVYVLLDLIKSSPTLSNSYSSSNAQWSGSSSSSPQSYTRNSVDSSGSTGSLYYNTNQQKYAPGGNLNDDLLHQFLKNMNI